MKGFVPTPVSVVDVMIEKLFRLGPPSLDAKLLDPGCGTGAFIEGVARWCAARGVRLPRITGIEANPDHAAIARTKFAQFQEIRIIDADFLASQDERFDYYDYVVGNPPYVPITSLSAGEKQAYRAKYATASGRFDLYLLFFEQSLASMNPGGRMVLITPEKFLYVETAAPLRDLLTAVQVEELHFIDEDTFEKLVTYPLISTVVRNPLASCTQVIHRDGSRNAVVLTPGTKSWLPAIRGVTSDKESFELADIADRISCGVATGADSVFVLANSDIPTELLEFAYPTISGRDIMPGRSPESTHSMLIPYDRLGKLLSETQLGPLGVFLSHPSRHARLMARSCVARKPWYAFHENPPLSDILRPKILCKDIGANPFFVIDRQGEIVPRHSVYYIVPSDPVAIEDLAAYLNSPIAQDWLKDHCQRAAQGFFRLQSHVLKRLPIPPELASGLLPLENGNAIEAQFA
jgi:adenine-specific DNA-methyltransferase